MKFLSVNTDFTNRHESLNTQKKLVDYLARICAKWLPDIVCLQEGSSKLEFVKIWDSKMNLNLFHQRLKGQEFLSLAWVRKQIFFFYSTSLTNFQNNDKFQWVRDHPASFIVSHEAKYISTCLEERETNKLFAVVGMHAHTRVRKKQAGFEDLGVFLEKIQPEVG